MYKKTVAGLSAGVAALALSVAGISGISKPGSAAASGPMARDLSLRVAGGPLARGAQLWVRLYRGARGTDSFPSAEAVSPGGGIVYVTGTTAPAGAGDFEGSIATVAYKTATGAELWARRYRGPGKGFDQAASMVVSGGKVFVTGSSATGPGSLQNYATIAYNAATGAQLWVSSFGGRRSNNSAAGVAVSGGRVFVTGCTVAQNGTNARYSTVAYDASTGARLWEVNFDRWGTGEGCATSLSVGPGGRLFVTGSIDNNFDTVAYNTATGARLWSRLFRSRLNQHDNPIGGVMVAASGGEVVVTGISATKTAAGYGTVAYSAATGARLWARHYANGPGSLSSPGSMAVSGGKVFVTGGTILASEGFGYATVAYNLSTGARLWARLYQGTGSVGNSAASVAVSPGGRTVYVTGTSSSHRYTGGAYATIAYNAATGAQLWVRRYPGHTQYGNDASLVAVSLRTGLIFVTGTRYARSIGGRYPASSYATIAYRG